MILARRLTLAISLLATLAAARVVAETLPKLTEPIEALSERTAKPAEKCCTSDATLLLPVGLTPETSVLMTFDQASSHL